MTCHDLLLPILSQLSRGQSLSEAQAQQMFEAIMTGGATEAQIASVLTAMQVRPGGPTVDEITGAARVMRRYAARVEPPPGVEVIDTCGTGGVGGVTFNVSTAAAIIAAGAGAYVAKHGNRAVTSRSGSSQVLEALGVNIAATGPVLTRCLAEARICFCFAPAHHPAMKYAIGPRRELGFRTIFNLLGPLTNPAGARRQLIGTASAALADTLAQVLRNLGAVHAMVVHGDGQDDLATTGETHIATVLRGEVVTTTITPERLGLKRASIEELTITDPADSAALIRRVLEGEQGAARDIAALNAAAALVVADLAADLPEGLARAFEAIDSGRAKRSLELLVRLSGSA